jgi:hypothetical protein
MNNLTKAFFRTVEQSGDLKKIAKQNDERGEQAREMIKLNKKSDK